MQRIWLILFVPALFLASRPTSAQESSLRKFIDAEIQAGWKKNNITPAPQASDAAFLRRVYLDLLGTVPSLKETKAFLADTNANKRETLVDRLLEDPRFAEHQADVWDLVLFGRKPFNIFATRNRDGFKDWLKEQFARNTPYDELVRQLLTAQSGGPQMFLVQYRNDPQEATVGITRKFLGTQLQCARCHDHPFEDWKQTDFYGMAGFVTRLVVVDKGGKGDDRYMIGEKSTGEVLFTGSAKEQKPGQKGEPIKPRFLGGDLLKEPAVPEKFKEPDWRRIKKNPPKPFFSRREKLAEWVTHPKNPYFAKAVTNRVWAQFMGRGQIHPVDDLSATRKPTHPKLFEIMTQQMIEHKFDLKWFIRELVTSETYQLASTGKLHDALPTWYQRARVRPLSAEEMLAALRVATGYDEQIRASGKDPAKTKLPNSFDSYTMRYLAEPTDGRGDFQAGLSEHLLFNNRSQGLISTGKGSLVYEMVQSKAPWPEKVDQLYLSMLTRLPTEAERKRFVSYLSGEGRTQDLAQDAVWVLLNCSEFRFNH